MQANTTQVGGEHYRAAPFQHWDLAARLKLGYFEGQITKYITRHPRKNGAQDALKALHFTVKLAELAVTSGWQPAHLFPTQAMLDDYSASNRLSAMDFRIIRDVLTWQHRRDLDRVKVAIAELIMRQYGSRYIKDIVKCLGSADTVEELYCAVSSGEMEKLYEAMNPVKGQYRPVCTPPSDTPVSRHHAYQGVAQHITAEREGEPPLEISVYASSPTLDGGIFRNTTYAAAATKEIRPTDAGQVFLDMAIAVRKVTDITESTIEKGHPPTDGSAPDAGYVNQD